ncbi:unnamed protein product [Ostreobium quekettii]|uniref:CCZ1/INTU/HSP4 first Longin domain-containing protein n=1 Tax=Ostreobium quekettii TaxID=121088 RepID=A0A8S1JF73_9CHLO|nr:unnamed protein product [Ostreobium quekettii]|eukprot:evm.model.scf_317.3 EVM.evm.TU.scf_317.3   scf_317:24918-25619(+)
MPPWGARRTASSALSLNRAASLALGRAASAPLPVRVLPAHRTPLQLFVFDTRRGNREGCESDKALAFYPPEMPPDDQLGTIGLAQALVTFIGTFAPGEGRLHTLETERHWWGVKRFEEGIWFGVVVEKTWGPGRMGGGACGALLEEVYAWALMLHGSVNRLLERDPSGQGAAVSVQAVIEMWGDRLVGARGKGDKGDKGEYESPFGLARHRAVPAIPLGRAAALATQVMIRKA